MSHLSSDGDDSRGKCLQALKEVDVSEIVKEINVAWQSNIESIRTETSIKNWITEGNIDPSDVNLEVCNIGKVTFPITFKHATELINVVSKARTNNQTESKVYIIPCDKINVSIQNMDKVITHICQQLDIDDNVLKAHLQSLMIYAEGQSFDLHVDAKKPKNVLSTWIISLPSAHIGGDMTIYHFGDYYEFYSETLRADQAKYIAFNSNSCQKIDRVREGYRVTLTFDLVLEEPKLLQTISCTLQLLKVVYEYFQFSMKKFFSDEIEYPVLVCLLNKSYDENNFYFCNLISPDDRTASIFLAVAQKLKLVFSFALVKITEHYEAESRDYYGPKYELVNTSMSFYSWRGIHGQSLIYYSHIDELNICWLVPNSEFPQDDTKTEYNDGVEPDQEIYYTRAAIVLRPKCDKWRTILGYGEETVKLQVVTKSAERNNVSTNT